MVYGNDFMLVCAYFSVINSQFPRQEHSMTKERKKIALSLRPLFNAGTTCLF